MVTTSYRSRDGKALGTVPDSSNADVERVVSRAVAAAPSVAGVSPAERRRWLDQLAAALSEHRDELVALADEETGLGSVRLNGEVDRMAAQLRFYGEVAATGRYLGVTRDEGEVRVRINQPLGPVAVFGASNFPFAFGLLGNDTASALAAGCPVVAKAHPAHALLCERLAEIAGEALGAAGAPDGTLGMVRGMEAGAAVVRAAGVSAVGFTGSQTGGLALWRIANEREQVIPVYAEMGTINPVVLTPAGAATRAAEVAEGFVGSFTLGVGQFCTKPGLLLAPLGYDVPQLVAASLSAAALRSTMLTEGIAAAARRGVEQLVAAGAEPLAQVPGPEQGWSADAVVLRATVADLAREERLREECFGPVALVIEYADEPELRQALALLQGSLAGSVFTDDTSNDAHAGWIIHTLAGQVGRVTVNEWPTGVAWTWAQHHGGPWPATSRPESTSVGAAALERWVRPVAYQGVAEEWLPPAGQIANPWGIEQRRGGAQ